MTTFVCLSRLSEEMTCSSAFPPFSTSFHFQILASLRNPRRSKIWLSSMNSCCHNGYAALSPVGSLRPLRLNYSRKKLTKKHWSLNFLTSCCLKNHASKSFLSMTLEDHLHAILSSPEFPHKIPHKRLPLGK